MIFKLKTIWPKSHNILRLRHVIRYPTAASKTTLEISLPLTSMSYSSSFCICTIRCAPSHRLSLKKAEISTISFFFQIRPGDEAQCRGVDAIPQARGRGAVVEHVPQVGIRMFAAHFCALHKKALVGFFHDVSGDRGRVKLGHPVPESNLSVDENRGSPDTMST